MKQHNAAPARKIFGRPKRAWIMRVPTSSRDPLPITGHYQRHQER
jgi:hypothetical protein